MLEEVIDLQAGSPAPEAPRLFNDATDVAARLDELAERLPNRDGERLTSLADAVRGGDSLTTWAAVSPLEHIEPRAVAERLVPVAPLRRLMQVAEIARNALLFAPVLFTWYALSQAVAAYHQLLSAEPAQRTEPFLLLWQDGFGGRVGFLTLENVALLDGVLVFVVLALTVLTTWWNQHSTSERQRHVERVASEVRAAVADAGLVLAGVRKPPDLAFLELSTVSKSLLEDLAEQRLSVHRLSADLQEQATVLSESLETLRRVGRRVDAASGVIQREATSFQETARDVEESARTMQTVEANLGASAAAMSSQLAAAVASQQAYADDLRSITFDLRASMQSLGTSDKESRDVLGTVVTTINELLNTIAGERAAQEALAIVVSSAMLDVETALQRLEQSADSALALTNEVRGLAADLPGVQESFARWLPVMVDQQTQLLEALSAAARPAPDRHAASAAADES